MSRTGAGIAIALLAAATAAPAAAAPPAAFALRLEAEVALQPSEFGLPVAVAVAPFGRVFVADAGKGLIARVDASGHIMYAFETPGDQPALQPLDLEVTGFQVFVVDAHSASLLRYSDQGGFLDVLRSFRETGMETPRAVAVDGAGRVLLAETTRHVVRLLDEEQNTETVVGGFGARPGELSRPLGVAFATDGSFFVADTGHSRIQKFSAVGNFAAAFGDSMSEPRGMVVGSGNELFVADVRRESVRLFGPEGQPRGELLLTGREPLDVATVGDTLWILVARPPALLRAYIEREQASE